MGGSFEIVVVLRELEVTYVRGRADEEELMTVVSRLLEMRSRLISVRTMVVQVVQKANQLHFTIAIRTYLSFTRMTWAIRICW